MSTPPVQITDHGLDPEAKRIAPALAAYGLDAVDLDMIKRGDMLGSKLGPTTFSALSALVTELLAAREGWQPIETAPRDGALMLLSDVNWPHAERRGGAPVKVGGYWDARWNVFGASWQPTHWRPLPTPPAKETTNAA